MKIRQFATGSGFVFLAFVITALSHPPEVRAEDPLPSAVSAGLEPVLERLSILLFSDAEAALRQIPAEVRETPAGWTTAALVLLQSQPRTTRKILEAEALLERAWNGGEGELAPIAGYTRARIPQIHREIPDPAEAMSRFEELSARFPRHPLAEMGRVKHASLYLSLSSDRGELRQRIAELAETVGEYTDSTARRDLHSLLGHALLLAEIDAGGALRHLLAAFEEGIPESSVRYRGYLVRIAELARVEGETVIARAFYEKFLDAFPRDDRRLIITKRLEALEP